MSRYDDDCWCDEDRGDRLPLGKAECPKCGEILPESHMETDSGNCISCEDAESEELETADVYANCLQGLRRKK